MLQFWAVTVFSAQTARCLHGVSVTPTVWYNEEGVAKLDLNDIKGILQASQC